MLHLLVALGVGVAVMIIVGVTVRWGTGSLIGWDAAALVLVASTWLTAWPMSADRTAQHAKSEDPARFVRDLVVLAAAIASLVGVAFVEVASGNSHGTTKGLLICLGLVTVLLSWAVVHTSFALRYAGLYYAGQPGGIDFHDKGATGKYSDFAYVAFTIGMTFQVADTNLRTKQLRKTVLRQALLSYVFGVVIIAITINVIASLAK
jgi:uncharacterized membrane protein